MYRSLSNLLTENGFKNPVILNSGDTLIKDPGSLNLKEKEDESYLLKRLLKLDIIQNDVFNCNIYAGGAVW